MALLGAVALAALLVGAPAVASLASVAAVAVPLAALVRGAFDDGSAVTPVLAGVALFAFGMLGAIELLAAFSLLASRPAWVLLTLVAAAGLALFAGRRPPAARRPDRLRLVPFAAAVREPWSLIVAPLAVLFGVLFAQSAYLNLFTGINHADGQAFYLARSIRYLQDGNLATYATVNDYRPHLHQTVSAYLLLFFESESAILLLSSLAGGLTGLALFDLSRLMRPPVSLSVLVAISPLAVPIVSLHLGTTNFDLHTALLLVLTIYFAVLARRTGRAAYIVLAAIAVALALALKPTFWFAAPALGLLGLGLLTEVARRRGLRAAAIVAVMVAAIIAIGGIHFARNAWYLGFVIAPDRPEVGQAHAATARERLDIAVFHLAASSATLLTPDILLGERGRVALTGAFRGAMERIGIALPDPRIFFFPDRTWGDVFDHLSTPFHSDKAGFGAVVPLLVAPAALWAVVDAGRRRAFVSIPTCLVGFAALYLLTLSLVLKYAADHVRYQIEMVVPLLALIPLLIVRLPRAVGLAYLAVAAGYLAADAYQAYAWSSVRPPGRVTAVARDLQYPTFVAPERMGYFTGARVLNRKYPVEGWPELFLLKRELHDGDHFEYPFLDLQGRRRLTAWTTDLERPRPPWPGPLLVTDPELAGVLRERFADQLVLDRLSDLAWVALPLDRLRVTWAGDPEVGAGPATFRVRAHVDRERYRRPEYRFATIDAAGGRSSPLRDFAADPTFALPTSALAPTLDLLVEVREAGGSGPVEQARLPMRTMVGQ